LPGSITWSEVFQTLLTGNRLFIHNLLKEKLQVEELRKFHGFAASTKTPPAIQEWLVTTAKKQGFNDYGKVVTEIILQARKGHEWSYVLMKMMEESSLRKQNPF